MNKKQASFSGVRSVAKNTAFLTATRGINIAARMVYIILVARLLGPELYALLAFSQSWYLTFLPIGIFGLGDIVLRTIALHPSHATNIASQSLSIHLIMASAASITCAALAWIILPDSDAPLLISVLVLALIGRTLSAWADNLFVAFDTPSNILRHEVFFRVAELILAIVILLSGGSLLLLAAFHAIVWWAHAARGIFVVRRDLMPIRLTWSTNTLIPVALTGIPFVLIALAVSWMMRGPIIIFHGLAETDIVFSQYALAMQILFIAAMLPISLGHAAQPVVTRAVKRGDGKDIVYAHAILRLSFILGTIAGLGGLTFGPWFIELLFGEEFVVAGQLVGLTLWCLIPIFGTSAFPTVILARGHFRILMLAAVTGALAMTCILPFLAMAFGSRGAVVSVGLGFAASLMVTSAFTAKAGWANPFITMVRPSIVTIITGAVYFSLAPVSLSLAFPTAILILIVGSLTLRVITKDEREFLISIWRKKGSRTGNR
jgi:O-antigen/teichoic acid export membrane protein